MVLSGQFFTLQLLLMRSSSAVFKTSSLPNRTMKDFCGATKASDRLHSLYLLLNFLIKTSQKQNCVFSWGQTINKQPHLLCLRMSQILYSFWSPDKTKAPQTQWVLTALVLRLCTFLLFIDLCGFFPVFHLKYFSPTNICLSCIKHIEHITPCVILW